ncbi:MAG TPA: HNH endonuclease, partial [Mycobacterium sp.]|nr:HNH endonuclease [Mycobacterium sp.]
MAVNRSRRARAARKRKRRMDQVVNDLTSEQWEALKAAWQGCAYC